MESGIWEILLAESKILGFRIWNTAQGILNPTNNRPLPSSTNPHFQNEARCTTFLVKMSFICMRMKNDFHINGWAPTLVLKQRAGGTQKWPSLGFFPIHYVNLVLLETNVPLHKSACFGKKKVDWTFDQWNLKNQLADVYMLQCWCSCQGFWQSWARGTWDCQFILEVLHFNT